MNFQIVDTESAYRHLLDAPDAAIREAIFRQKLIEPFIGLVQFFGGDGPATFAQWGMKPEQFYAGYAIGYRVVQAYLERTGKSVVETTFVPAQTIIADSGFFE
jgi:uncharacterized protein YjaZ